MSMTPMTSQDRAIRTLIDACNNRIAEANREKSMLLALLPEEKSSGDDAMSRAKAALADIRQALKDNRRVRESIA